MSISKHIQDLLEGKKFKLPAGDWMRDTLDVEEIKKDKLYKINGIDVVIKQDFIIVDGERVGTVTKLGKNDYIAQSNSSNADRNGSTKIEAAASLLALIGAI